MVGKGPQQREIGLRVGAGGHHFLEGLHDYKDARRTHMESVRHSRWRRAREDDVQLAVSLPPGRWT